MRLGKEYRDSLGGGRQGWVLGEGMCVVALSVSCPTAVSEVVVVSRRQTVWRRERSEVERPQGGFPCWSKSSVRRRAKGWISPGRDWAGPFTKGVPFPLARDLIIYELWDVTPRCMSLEGPQ
jgi:hypothetical protein